MIQVNELAGGPDEEQPWRTAARGVGATASLSMPASVGREASASVNLYTVQRHGEPGDILVQPSVAARR
jgi:hypothetical protein